MGDPHAAQRGTPVPQTGFCDLKCIRRFDIALDKLHALRAVQRCGVSRRLTCAVCAREGKFTVLVTGNKREDRGESN